MADDCSRLRHFSDDELVSYFNVKYPQPNPWRLCHLASALHSALRGEHRPLPDVFAETARGNDQARSWQIDASPGGARQTEVLFELLGKLQKTWVSTTLG